MSSPFIELEGLIHNLPIQASYRCTSDNKVVTRGIKDLSLKQARELKEKLEGEYASFETLLETHKNIDNRCMAIIEEQLAFVSQDKKQKEIHKQLKRRYEIAIESKSSLFYGNNDYGINVKSVLGMKLLNFIIKFHKHKCQYTNMFKDFCGDTKKEIKRLTMILNCDQIQKNSSISNNDEFEPPQVITQEDEKIIEMKKAISDIALDIDEDW